MGVHLEVISKNVDAIRLYCRAGFVELGRSADFFRVDGQSLASVAMSRRVAATD